MKRVISVLIAICILSVSWALCVGAISLENGKKYEVPITLIHAEKDKTSMGDKYIYNTALIEVEGKTKYLTMVTDSNVKNLNFWYYNDGSVSGDTTDAQIVNNIEIDGKTFSVGYRFPLCGDEQLVGVKFSASIMPMTPSARVKIDYDNAKEIASVVQSTESATTQQTTQTATTGVTTTKAIETTAAEPTSVQTPTVAPSAAESAVIETTSTLIQTHPEYAMASAAAPESIKITIEYPTVIPALAVIILICVAVLIIFSSKEGNDEK